MAEIVLIHGIAQEKERAATLEATWLSALSAGVRAAGDVGLAEQIRRAQERDGSLQVRMAYYADLFVEPQTQGNRPARLATDEELETVLASEWIRRAASRGSASNKDEATRRLRQLEPGEEMGLREEMLRRMVKAVAGLPWFAPSGLRLAEQFVWRSLEQVSAYFSDQQLRHRIQQRVFDQIGDDTRIVVGHSLGSVVAYEVAAQLDKPLDLLLTLGSPLGIRTIIYDRILPQPPMFPTYVHRWINIADRNDLVAAVPDLGPLFPVSNSSQLVSGWIHKPANRSPTVLDGTVSNGPEPHRASYYLQNWQVGQAVSRVLDVSSR